MYKLLIQELPSRSLGMINSTIIIKLYISFPFKSFPLDLWKWSCQLKHAIYQYIWKYPSEHTQYAALTSNFAIPIPPNNICPRANPNITTIFTSTTTHNLPIPCACHESFRVHTFKSLAPATKSDNIISFGMISTRSEHIPIHQNRHFS